MREIALLNATIIAFASQTAVAQAPAPNRAGVVRYLMTSRAEGLDRICIGDRVVFDVRAEREQNPNPPVIVAGVTASGSVLDPAVGTLTPASLKTATPAGSRAFTFRARSAGTTELRFTGMVAAPPQKYTSLTLPVSVVSCKSKQYKVTTVSTWNAGMEIVATIDDGTLIADDQGHFTGSANVKWQTSLIGTASCGAGEYTIPPSKADLVGDIDKSGQLVVTITFQPRDFSGWATCGPSISTSNLATPDPLTLTVATTGGTSTQEHAVTAKNGSFAGSATIVVTPEQD